MPQKINSNKKWPLKEENVSLCYHYYLVSCVFPIFCKSANLKQLWEKATIWTAEQSGGYIRVTQKQSRQCLMRFVVARCPRLQLDLSTTTSSDPVFWVRESLQLPQSNIPEAHFKVAWQPDCKPSVCDWRTRILTWNYKTSICLKSAETHI